MARPQKIRRVKHAPFHKNFKPSGIPARFLESIILTVDEYESIRLADYNGMGHAEAAEKMGVSRSVFTRLVERARKKVSQTIIEGKELVIDGGNIDFETETYRCEKCGSISISKKRKKREKCNKCGTTLFDNLNKMYEGEKDG